MQQFGGKDSKRHFTVVMGGKEHGLYVSSTPSSAAKKAVTKLCAANKSKNVEFSIREITQGSKKKIYGPYSGKIEKLKEPIELKGRVIRYKPVAKLSGKSGAKKGGMNRGSAAGPANSNPDPALDSSSNNNSSPPQEQIAFIILNTPDKRIENTDDYDEIIRQLEKIDNDIFDIRINLDSRGNGWGGREEVTSIFILLENYLKAKKNPNFKRHLQILIEVLKYFKQLADKKIYNTNFSLFEPDESFTPEHNDFLTYLHQELEKK